MKRLTCELLESASRNDHVSLELILQMRADEMARIEAAGEQIWLMAEQGPEEAGQVRWLMSQEFLRTGEPKGFEERNKVMHYTKPSLLYGTLTLPLVE